MKRRFLALVLAGCLAAVLSTAAWAMCLNVELPSGETIALDVESGDSINNVKQKVQNAAGVSVTEQYLYYGGKFLYNGRTLADYNIQKESTLLVASEAKGTPSGTPLTAAEPSKEWVDITEEKVLTEGTYFLCNNVNLTHPLVIQGDVTLDLNGFVLQYENSGANDSVIQVDSGTLTLVDSHPAAIHKFVKNTDDLWMLDESQGAGIVRGGIITGGNAGYNDGGGVYVCPGAELVMRGGSIVGCKAKQGGGVYVADKNEAKTLGRFTMKGGSIVGCVATDESYSGGTFNGQVRNSGVIENGQFNGAVNNYEGTIKGGTFNGSVTNEGAGRISGGTYNGSVYGTFYTVAFVSNGGTAVPNQKYANTPVTAPTVSRAGYTLVGWYTDEACTAAYDFTQPVTDNITLYAKWEAAPRYYYNSGTTETGKTDENKKGSPKTFDPGAGIYAVSVALSLTGTAWIGRKRH